MPVFRTAAGEPILATKLQGNLDFGDLHVEAYHLALALGYSQQHSIRKQVLTDWQDLFEEDVDYRLVHDEDLLRHYENLHDEFVGPIKPMRPERGRMFLSASGLRKVFAHSSKESGAVQAALASLIRVPIQPRPHLQLEDRQLEQPAEPEVARGAGSDGELEPLERRRQYEILETLLDHLRHIKEPALRRLALTSAELGLGRQLPDIRHLLEETRPVADSRAVPAPVAAPAPLSSIDRMAEPVVAEVSDKAALDYVEKRPFTQGAFFPPLKNVYYGLKQIGEKAGGYSAVQAGKAADLVAWRMGHTHDDIRQKKLEFNELPELPDTTSGKLRKMYRFNSDFANLVIKELRANQEFVASAPRDLSPFGQRTGELPTLSKGPFEE